MSGLRAPGLLLTLLLALLVGGVVTAGPASAHAVVESTTPADGARLETVPDEVSIGFNEGVSLAAGYARVIGPGGDQVDRGDAQVDDQVVTVPLPDGLPDGSYVVTYRVLSADSHPVTGAYAFVVGSGALVPATTVELGSAVAPAVATALPVSKWLGYLGILLAAGTAVFLSACWPAGWSRRGPRRLVVTGIGLLGLSGVTGFLLQGPYAAGAGLGAVLDPDLLAVSLGSAYGQVLLARVGLAAALAVLVVRVLRPGAVAPGRVPRVVGAVLLAAAATTLTVIGHAVAGSWPVLAVLSNTAHLVAMAVWIGGLAVLAVAVLPRGAPRPGTIGEMTVALTRFSRIAFASVGVLVATGIFQSVREVGSFTGLFTTTYGWLLVTKLAVFLVVLALAAVARDWVQQHGVADRPHDEHDEPDELDDEPDADVEPGLLVPSAGRARLVAVPDAGPTALVQVVDRPGDAPDDVEEADADRDQQVVVDRRGRPVTEAHVRTVRRSLVVEVALAVVVLAITAVLTGTPPAGATVTRPVDTMLQLGTEEAPEGSVQISLTPGQVGVNTLGVYLYDTGGALYDAVDVTARVVERDQQIGPLDVDLENQGTGRYSSPDVAVPVAGTWTLTVTVRSDEFTAASVEHEFTVN